MFTYEENIYLQTLNSLRSSLRPCGLAWKSISRWRR